MSIARHIHETLSNGGRVALICNPTPDEILAATGVGYYAHVNTCDFHLVKQDAYQPALDEVVFQMPACTREIEQAFVQRVWNGFVKVTCKEKQSKTELRHLVYACASDNPTMPEIVHHYLRLGFSVGNQIHEDITCKEVAAFLGLVRHTSNECEKTRQFVRFSQQSDGTFMARFSPAAHTIPLVASYFAARMRPERFVLVDPVHLVAAFHEKDARYCGIAQLDRHIAEELTSTHNLAQEEQYIRAMWKHFYDAMELEGRRKEQRGYDLRVSWMPKRFWSELPELSALSDNAGSLIPHRYAGTHGSDAVTPQLKQAEQTKPGRSLM